MVNNSNAQGNVQTHLELRKENYPREQSSHRLRNPNWASRNQVAGGWESVGDDGVDWDDDYGNIGRMANLY